MINKIIKLFSKTKTIKRNTTNKTVDDRYRLSLLSKTKKSIKLHFGCGPRVLKDWINIDLIFEPYKNYLKYYTNKFYGPKVRGDKSDFFAFDITKKSLPLPDNSVDVIFHEDFIEHLDQKEQIIFLAETLRVLKPGGVHRVNTPNLAYSMNENSNFKIGNMGIFTDEWDKHVHKNILTPASLKDLALLVGYSKVIFQKRNKSVVYNLPLEYRPDPTDRPEKGNIFADLIK